MTQDMTRLFTHHLPTAIASINTSGGKRTTGKGGNGAFAGSNLYGQGPPREEGGGEGLEARVVPEGQGGERTDTGDGGAPAPRIP
jgi:hypothetical protein